tara:strand:- start:8753 stop:9046 length:294 start_codon:yes stop_codon:yes gene_type:complete
MKNYFLAFKNIFNYKSEATMSEFWSFFIINIIVSFLFTILIEKLSLNNIILITYRIITFLVLFSLGFRRIKNAGLSGWLFLIPIANVILASLPEKKS